MSETRLDRLPGSVQENRQQDRTDAAIGAAERRAKAAIGAIASGELLTGLEVKAASFTGFPHSLGRAWNGYVMTKAFADVRIFSEAGGDDDRELRLKSSSDATVDVWVF